MNIQTLLSIIGSVIGIFLFVIGALKLKEFITYTIKEGTSEAATLAINNWKEVADSQKRRMEEMDFSIKDLTKQVKILSDEKVDLTNKVDKLQRAIDAMIGVDGVGKMLESAIPHFDLRMNEIEKQQNIIITMLQGKQGDNIVNLTTK